MASAFQSSRYSAFLFWSTYRPTAPVFWPVLSRPFLSLGRGSVYGPTECLYQPVVSIISGWKKSAEEVVAQEGREEAIEKAKALAKVPSGNRPSPPEVSRSKNQVQTTPPPNSAERNSLLQCT